MRKSKRRGVFSIEAALILPILLFVILIFLDMLYLAYVKTNAKSNIELSILQSKEDMSELKNNDFNGIKRSSKSIDGFLNNKLKRSIFDELNFKLNEEGFVNRASAEMLRSLDKGENWKSMIRSNRDSSLFYYAFELKYDLKFKSFLSDFYFKNGLKANQLHGKTSFKEHRIFDEIVSIDTIYNLAKQSKTAGKIASDFKKALSKMKE